MCDTSKVQSTPVRVSAEREGSRLTLALPLAHLAGRHISTGDPRWKRVLSLGTAVLRWSVRAVRSIHLRRHLDIGTIGRKWGGGELERLDLPLPFL